MLSLGDAFIANWFDFWDLFGTLGPRRIAHSFFDSCMLPLMINATFQQVPVKDPLRTSPLVVFRFSSRKEGLFDVAQERKEPALRMAKQVWQEAPSQVETRGRNG